MDLLASLGTRLRRALDDLGRARDGIAAVEFALVLPVALFLYLGAAVVADGVMTNRKTSQLARTLIDLTSQMPTSNQATSTPAPQNAVTSQTLSLALTSSAMLLYPKSTSALQMTVSAIDVTNTSGGLCCNVTVRWSFTQNGQLRSCSAGQSGLPSSLVPAAGVPLVTPLHYIAVDVTYTYQPIISTNLINFAPTFQRTEYMMPRTTGQVTTVQPLQSTGVQSGIVCY